MNTPAIVRYRRYGKGRRIRLDYPDGSRGEIPDTAAGRARLQRLKGEWWGALVDLREHGCLRKDEALRLLYAEGVKEAGSAPYRCSRCKRPFSCRTAFDQHHEIIRERPGIRCHVPEEVGLIWRGDRRGAPAFGWPPSGAEIPSEPSSSSPVHGEGSDARSAQQTPVGAPA